MTRIDRLEQGSLTSAAQFVAMLQGDPAHHIGYLGTDASALAEQLAGLEPIGLAGTLVAHDDAGDLVGLMSAEWDTDPPRVWWHGPLVREGDDWDEVADGLLVAGRELLPAEVVEEELAPDARNARVAAFAARNGFAREVASAALSCSLVDGPAPVRRPDEVTVHALADEDRAEVASLHDALFPGTHTPGARIDEGDDRIVLVARRAGTPVGYVAAEIQEDGDGYLDYLGVEASARRLGLGAVLVVEACAELAASGSTCVNLTVREDNALARRLYARLGFVEERVLVPWRRGITM